MLAALRGWRRLAVALAAGALSALGFAPFNAFVVLFLTVPAFVWLLDGAANDELSAIRRLAGAAAIGWAFGFGFFLAGLWWIGEAFLIDAGGFVTLMPVAVLALPALLALFWAAGAALSGALPVAGAARVPLFAISFTIAEYARGHLLTGFPWNAFGYALTPAPLMMQSVSLAGVWGLTLIAFFVFAAPASLADDNPRGAVIILGAAALLLVADLGFGAVRLAGATDAVVAGVHLRIVQPSIPQDERWQAAEADAILQQFAALSSSAPNVPSTPAFTLLLWPESALPFFLTERPDALQTIADILPDGAALITGAARRDPAAGPDAPVYNSVLVIGDDGKVRSTYDKVHLVPFGEYLPWRSLFDALGIRQLVAIPGGFTPGAIRQPLVPPGAPAFAPLICYEAIFPAAVVDPRNRPAWLMNVTNDAWYGDTPGPYQHFLAARVRAVEEGLPLARAANSGISAIVDGYGRVLGSLPLGEVGVLDGALPAALQPTLYARFGDLVLAAMLCLTGIGAVVCKIYLSFERQLTRMNLPAQYPPPSTRGSQTSARR